MSVERESAETIKQHLSEHSSGRPEAGDAAVLTLTIPMGEHVQSLAEVAGVIAYFVDACRPSLEAGRLVSGPIHNEDGYKVGMYRMSFGEDKPRPDDPDYVGITNY